MRLQPLFAGPMAIRYESSIIALPALWAFSAACPSAATNADLMRLLWVDLHEKSLSWISIYAGAPEITSSGSWSSAQSTPKELRPIAIAIVRNASKCTGAKTVCGLSRNAFSLSCILAYLFVSVRKSWSFQKFHPAWIRLVRQNHRIILGDACNPALARNVRL